MLLLADLWTHSWPLLPPEFQAASAESPWLFLILGAMLVLALLGFVICLGSSKNSCCPRKTCLWAAGGRNHGSPGSLLRWASPASPALSAAGSTTALRRHGGNSLGPPRALARIAAVSPFTTGLGQRYASVLVKAVLLSPPGSDRQTGP
jgi:hypothetical protein